MTHRGDPLLYVVTHAALATSLFIASLRWLRVCQREHYLGGYTAKFAIRWWLGSARINVVLLVVAIVCAIAATWIPVMGLAVAVILLVGPVGLGIRGRTSSLVFTGRMKRLTAVVWFDLLVLAVAFFWLLPFGVTFLGLSGLAIPLLVDLCARYMAAFEKSLSSRFVARARRKLLEIGPIVVAVTGSYGKTSTKEYIRQLLGATYRVVASPSSFNNQLGLARTVNEHLIPGTEVMVVEMGDYGPGEILEMCMWLQPKIGVVTAVGYEHFERFKSMDAIVSSKREVFVTVETAVIGIDSEPLMEMVEGVQTEQGKKVLTASGDGREAYVSAIGSESEIEISVSGERLTVIPRENRHPLNVAVAVAAAKALDVPDQLLVGLLPALESPAHRAAIELGPTGITIIDDTYNSNPVGAMAALEMLARTRGTGRRVVVSPGMVEMGSEQERLNAEFSRKAAELVTDFVIVGHTNRKSLREGLGDASRNINVVEVLRREQATEWVRKNLKAGDSVLYENDLPDHFP